MSFLDPKEEVIKFELTAYGKYKHSKGDLRPAFYSFGDSKILYDITAASGSEQQKETGNRIYNDTAFLGGQFHLLSGIEADDNYVDEFEKNDQSIYVLGTANTYRNSGSNLEFNLLKGQLDSVSTIRNGFYLATSSIRFQVVETDLNTTVDDVPDFVEYENKKFYVQDDYIIVEIEETEIFDEKYSLKIQDPETKKYYSFSLSETDFFEEGTIDQKLFVLADKEIPQQILCNVIPAHKKKKFFEQKILECPDRNAPTDWTNIYNKSRKFNGVCE